jgi:hypothetical protein
MRPMSEITSDGDIIEDGEIHPLFDFDPEALSDDPLD